jgi:hypothetical protein
MIYFKKMMRIFGAGLFLWGTHVWGSPDQMLEIPVKAHHLGGSQGNLKTVGHIKLQLDCEEVMGSDAHCSVTLHSFPTLRVVIGGAYKTLPPSFFEYFQREDTDFTLGSQTLTQLCADDIPPDIKNLTRERRCPLTPSLLEFLWDNSSMADGLVSLSHKKISALKDQLPKRVKQNTLSPLAQLSVDLQEEAVRNKDKMLQKAVFSFVKEDWVQQAHKDVVFRALRFDKQTLTLPEKRLNGVKNPTYEDIFRDSLERETAQKGFKRLPPEDFTTFMREARKIWADFDFEGFFDLFQENEDLARESLLQEVTQNEDLRKQTTGKGYDPTLLEKGSVKDVLTSAIHETGLSQERLDNLWDMLCSVLGLDVSQRATLEMLLDLWVKDECTKQGKTRLSPTSLKAVRNTMDNCCSVQEWQIACDVLIEAESQELPEEFPDEGQTFDQTNYALPHKFTLLEKEVQKIIWGVTERGVARKPQHDEVKQKIDCMKDLQHALYERDKVFLIDDLRTYLEVCDNDYVIMF